MLLSAVVRTTVYNNYVMAISGFNGLIRGDIEK